MIQCLLVAILLLAPPTLREVEEKYLVISPMKLEVGWMTEREIRKVLEAEDEWRSQVAQSQIKELWADPTVDMIYKYDRNYIYIRRRGKTFLDQYVINGKPCEKIKIVYPKRSVNSSMLAPLGVTEMGYDNKGKPVISNEALLGLANALLFEATVGSIVYTVWTHSPTAGIVSLGLTYASYRVIRKAL